MFDAPALRRFLTPSPGVCLCPIPTEILRPPPARRVPAARDRVAGGGSRVPTAMARVSNSSPGEDLSFPISWNEFRSWPPRRPDEGKS